MNGVRPLTFSGYLEGSDLSGPRTLSPFALLFTVIKHGQYRPEASDPNCILNYHCRANMTSGTCLAPTVLASLAASSMSAATTSGWEM